MFNNGINIAINIIINVSVTIGAIFSGSYIKPEKWLVVIHLICSSKRGISAHQMYRLFEITCKSAWYMMH